MNKTVCLFLCLVTVLSAMSCSETKVPSEKIDTQPEFVFTEAPENTGPKLSDTTYQGETVNFLVISENHNANNYSVEVFSDGMDGDPINDAVFLRNTYVESTYDVKITEYRADDPAASAKTAILAADDVYDVFLIGMDECIQAALLGGLLDLHAVPYVDLTREWWDSNINDAMTIKGITYAAVGDINIMDDNATWVTFFNKKIAADSGLPDFYKIVDDGIWTMDTLLLNARLTNMDLDGDGEITYLDRFGIGTDKYNFTNLLLGSGSRFWDSDNSGNLVNVFYSERTMAVCEKIFAVMYDAPTTVNADLYWGKVEGTPTSTVLRKAFGEDRMTFYIASMLTYSLMRGMESDFGLLPLPKYDETQEQYYSAVLPRNASAVSVPKTNQRLELTGTILEAMAAKSADTLTPAYYDCTIYAKGIRDEDSARMFDIVRANRIVDIGAVFDFGGMIAAFQDMTLRMDTNISSKYAKLIEKAQKAADESMATLYQYE